MGVAPSALLGKPRAEVHEHFDSDGHLTGSTVVHTGPEFTRDDVALLLASRRRSESLSNIGPHGIPMSEAMDPENDGAFDAVLRIDYAAKALELAQEKHKAEYPHENRKGLRWALRRRAGS